MIPENEGYHFYFPESLMILKQPSWLTSGRISSLSSYLFEDFFPEDFFFDDFPATEFTSKY
jgi:hypothetical protein